MGKVVKKIVLTGGPGAGKSSSLDLIKNYLKELGYFILVVNESATELINSGIKPFGVNKLSMFNFQDVILNYQLEKEKIIENTAKNFIEDDVIIIYDRGLLDNKAYIGQEEFDKLLEKYNLKEINLLNRYDLVICLETGAKSKYYRTDNNSARSESKEEAIKMDNKTFEAWKNHNNLFRVKCFEDFCDKQNEIIKIIDIALNKNSIK